MNPRTIRAVWDHWSKGRSTMEIVRCMKGREEPEICSILHKLLLLKMQGKPMPWEKPQQPDKVVVGLPRQRRRA